MSWLLSLRLYRSGLSEIEKRGKPGKGGEGGRGRAKLKGKDRRQRERAKMKRERKKLFFGLDRALGFF